MDLVISDIHADISALNTIMDLVTTVNFKKKYGEISRIINLGDVLERGTHPKQVLEKMEELSKNYPVISVKERCALILSRELPLISLPYKNASS